MTANSLAGIVRILLIALASVAVVAPAWSQSQPQPPSAARIALAKEIITIKGSANIFDPILPDLVDKSRAMFLRTNPMVGKDLNDVAGQLRTEFSPRSAELVMEMAKAYAAAFTEQELKDALAFYKSPLGKKMITAEPRVLDQTFNLLNTWSEKMSEEIISRMRTEMKKKGHDL
jgi:hypothetical protein